MNLLGTPLKELQTLEIFTMDSFSLTSSERGIKAWQTQKVPRTLRSKVLCQVSSEQSKMVPPGTILQQFIIEIEIEANCSKFHNM